MDIPILLWHWLERIFLFLYPLWMPKGWGLSCHCLQDCIQCPEHNICLLNESTSEWMQVERYNKGSHHLLRDGSMPGAKCFTNIHYLIETSQQPLWVGTSKGILLAILSFCLINRSARLEVVTSAASLEGWPRDHIWQIRCRQKSTEWGF